MEAAEQQVEATDEPDQPRSVEAGWRDERAVQLRARSAGQQEEAAAAAAATEVDADAGAESQNLDGIVVGKVYRFALGLSTRPIGAAAFVVDAALLIPWLRLTRDMKR